MKLIGVHSRSFVVPYFILGGLLIALFAWAAFYQLDVRPLHHDEGVNASFLHNLVTSFSSYKYDPNNYHGPSPYYIQLIPTYVCSLFKDGPGRFSLHSTSGITATTMRASVVVAALLMLLGILCSHRHLGFCGSLCTMLLLMSSCDFVYFSRYFIHESFLVLFTLGIYLAMVSYADARRAVFLYLTALSAALAYCTKETSAIAFAVLVFSYFVAHALSLRRTTPDGKLPMGQLLQEARATVQAVLVGHPFVLALASLVVVLLYTSFFTNWGGIADSVLAYLPWLKEGVRSGHNKPFFYYLNAILLRYEIPLCLFSFVGFHIALLTAEKKGLYLACWTFCMLVIYSAIPYKTPWLVLNFLLPMALLAGYGCQKTMDWIDGKAVHKTAAKAAFLCVLMLSIGLQLPKLWRVVYVEYDRESHPQAYVHTSRDIAKLVRKIAAIAEQSGLGRSMPIHVLSPQCWPLQIYLKNYDKAVFEGRITNAPALDAPVIIATPWQRAELFPRLKNSYFVKEYSLRPNSPLLLYVDTRYDTAAAYDVAKKTPTVLAPAAIEIAGLQPFLHRQIIDGPRFDGQILDTAPAVQDVDFRWHDEAAKPFASPFSIRYWGYILIPATGVYAFSLESDDGSWLYLDDYKIVNNGGSHTRIKRSSLVRLEAGYHKLEIRYFDLSDEALLRVKWIPPGGSETKIPADILFHAK